MGMESEAVEILKEIRDEAKQTNLRLDQTNVRLESVERRFDSLEKRVSKGFEDLVTSFSALGRRQAESELRLATEVLSLADVTRDVRDLLSRKLDDHKLVVDLEKRVQLLEVHSGRSQD